MLVEDLFVEVRDVDLVRRGSIPRRLLDMKVHDVHLGVGDWQLRLPSEHGLVPLLREPGSGALFRVRGKMHMSGPMTTWAEETTKENPGGITTFKGVSDTVLLSHKVVLPDPAHPASEQLLGYDIRTGKAETVMKDFVKYNLGSLALPARRGLLDLFTLTATDLGRGPTVTKSARFTNLLELLGEIALYSNMGFRVIQVGNHLEFDVYEIRDRTSFVRFDVNNNTLASETLIQTAPGLTQVYVLGQGDLQDRKVVTVTNTQAEEDSEAFGFFIESVKDQRQTNDDAELAQAGAEDLEANGRILTDLNAVPSDDQTMVLGDDWDKGDLVTVQVLGQELPTTVTETAIVANSSGVAVAAAIGDPQPSTVEQRSAASVATRVGALERNTDSGTALQPAAGTDLNLMVREGRWLIDTAALANTVANLPVPPLPAVAPNMAVNEKTHPQQPVTTATNNGTYWAVTHGATLIAPQASPSGNLFCDVAMVTAAQVGQPSGIIGSVYNVDGLAGNSAQRVVTMAIRAENNAITGVAAEWQGNGGAWTPMPAGWNIVSWTVPANTQAILQVRRAGAAAPLTGDRIWITDVKAVYGIGTLRAASQGELVVTSTGTRVIQEFTAVSGVGGTRAFMYRRLRGSGGTWGPWRIVDPAIPVASDPEQDAIAKFLYATPDSPISVRRNDARSPVGYLTKNGDTWYSDFGTYISAPGWIAPPLASGWSNYTAGFASAVYRRTALGFVMMRGLISATASASWATVPIFTLPVGYRPAGKRMIEVNGGNVVGRIEILPTGEVFLRSAVGVASNGAISFLSLQSAFPVAEVAPESAWTNLAIQTGWYDYSTVDNSWPRASYWVDPVGRYWSRGLVGRAASPGAVDSPMVKYPAAAAIARQIHVSSLAVNVHCSEHITNDVTGPVLIWKPGGAPPWTWVSLPWYPIVPSAIAPDAVWQAQPLTSPWVNYNVATFPPASVWEAPDGLAHWRGLITGGAAGSNIGTIGSSWGPSATGTTIHAVNAAETMGRIDTSSAAMAYLLGPTSWLSLDGVMYLREA